MGEAGSSKHDNEQDGDEPERSRRKHKARLDRVIVYITLVSTGLAAGTAVIELVRAVFDH